MSSFISILESSNPEVTFQQCLEAFDRSKKDSDAFALTFSARQDYLPGAPLIDLLALVAFQRVADGRHRVGLSLTEPTSELLAALGDTHASWEALKAWCREQQMIWLDLSQPLALKPVHIAKPWGQEIWYTGIEARGQSEVGDDAGCSIPLPWLLAALPRYLTGSDGQQLVLLKVLDPLPEPVFGDLYFEMHEEKREVYVVTHVDEQAWPDGRGGIRFGFDQERRREAGGDPEFKRQYLEAVQAYRAVRVKIDERIDERRREQGIPLNDPLEPQTLKNWLADLPPELLAEEAAQRARMEAFIHVDPLQVGDVVKVPCYTPHSLLHGVRTVEFQTPVYERKILSFAQKVLTQSHWDTEEAMELVSLDPPEPAQLPLVAEDSNCRVEEVVDFEDFRVERLTLRSGAEHNLVAGGEYAVIMAVTGGLQVNQRLLAAEEAVLLPAGDQPQSLRFTGAGQGVILLARPQRSR